MKITFISSVVMAVFLFVGDAYCAKAKWQEFLSDDGNFSVMMPGHPSRQKNVDATRVGHIAENIYTWKSDDLTVTAEYSDLPGVAVFLGGHVAIYKRSRNAFLENVQGAEIAFDPITVEGYDGRELVYKTPMLFGKVLFLLVHERLYVMQGVVPSGGNKTRIDQFLRTFRLLNKVQINHPNRKHRNRWKTTQGL
jgi:hypothetical protein